MRKTRNASPVRVAGPVSPRPTDGNVALADDGHHCGRAADEVVDEGLLFTSLMESLPGLAYQIDFSPVMGLRFISGCAGLTGYEPEELAELSEVNSFGPMHPDDFDRRWEQVEKAAATLGPFEVTYRMLHRDGTTRTICERGRCWSEPGSDSVVAAGFIVDVTAPLPMSVGASPVGDGSQEALLLSSGGRVLFANVAASAAFGLPVEEMAGMTVAELVASDTTHLPPAATPPIVRPGEDDGLAVHRIVLAASASTSGAGGGRTAGRVFANNAIVHQIARQQIDERLRADQSTVLAAIAANRPLAETLDLMATMVEARIPGSRCAILTLSGTSLHVVAAPRLPPELVTVMEGLEIGPTVGSCGSAAFFSQPVTVGDIANDPRWVGYRDLVLPHGLVACWSVPIVATTAVLGTFAVYQEVTGPPSAAARITLDTFVALAAVAMGHANVKRQMAHDATHDPLTGLPNREHAVVVLQELLDRAEASGTSVAVAFADLDDFKLVNDRLGRRLGDGVLCAVADRLGAAVRDRDVLARFSGDEYVIFCPGIKPDSDLDSLPRRVERALADAIEVDGSCVFVRASVGVAVCHGTGDAEQLLADASAAMYQAKDAGRGGSQHFDESLRQRAHRRGRLENDLRNAIDRHEITLAYQPIVEMTTGRIVGAEALARWTTPDGPIGPDEFIPVAERTGLILALGTQVLSEAAAEAATWAAASDGPRYVSVNLSTRQLADPTLVAMVEAVLATTGLAPELLCLELTETAVMDDPNGAAKVLRALKDLGLKLAVDDFGTGYSSLTHLRRFPVDFLKVDRSFVNNVTLGGDDTTIVAAVAGLAANLGLDVVAEGVEQVEQTDELARLGCTYGQGYLWSRPKPPAEFRAMLDLED